MNSPNKVKAIGQLKREDLETLAFKTGIPAIPILTFLIDADSSILDRIRFCEIIQYMSELGELFFMTKTGSPLKVMMENRLERELPELLVMCNSPRDYVFLWLNVHRDFRPGIAEEANSRYMDFVRQIELYEIPVFTEMAHNFPEFSAAVKRRHFDLDAQRAGMLAEARKRGLIR